MFEIKFETLPNPFLMLIYQAF